MRVFLPLLATLTLSACAATPGVYTARMPVEILRSDGEPPRMGDVVLRAGGYAETMPFSLDVWFRSDGEALGAPRQVSWQVRYDDYCRDRPSWIQAVLIGPSGEVWRGWRTGVPAGPDRPDNVTSGTTGATGPRAVATPGLLEAMALGGRFIVAIEDDEGHRSNEEVIDTLTPAARTRLFNANREAVRKADPAMPVQGRQMLMMVGPAPYSPPPLRPCS